MLTWFRRSVAPKLCVFLLGVLAQLQAPETQESFHCGDMPLNLVWALEPGLTFLSQRHSCQKSQADVNLKVLWEFSNDL